MVKKTKEVKKTSKMNASQKISALEDQVLRLEKLIDTQARIFSEDIDALRETMRVVGQRLNASVKAAEAGEVSNDKIDEIMVNESRKELQNKVDFLVNHGVLKKEDDRVIDNKTFVVAQELHEGKVINPRIQFYTESLSDAEKAPFLGKKVGESVKYEGSDIITQITEVYAYTMPKVNQEFEEEETK